MERRSHPKSAKTMTAIAAMLPMILVIPAFAATSGGVEADIGQPVPPPLPPTPGTSSPRYAPPPQPPTYNRYRKGPIDRSSAYRTRRGRVDRRTFSRRRSRSHGYKVVFDLFGGLRLYGDELELGTLPAGWQCTTGSHPCGPQPGPMAGFRFGYNLNRVFGLMGEVAYSPTTYVDGGERAHVVSWSGHAVFYLSLRGARPFILVGGGQEALTNTVNLPKTGERIEPDNDGGIHIGMGVKFDVARDLSLRIEYRAVQADGPDNEFGIIHQFSAGISLRLSAHH